MRKRLSFLVQWCRSPLRSGFAELDLQIEKLRTLRDSYQTVCHKQQDFRSTEILKGKERLCVQ